MLRSINFVVAALFAIFGAIQLNDPDPLPWVLTYGLVTILALLAGFQRFYPRWNYVSLGTIVALGAVSIPGSIEYLGSGQWTALTAAMSVDRPYIEAARELLGLLLAAAAIWCLIHQSRAAHVSVD